MCREDSITAAHTTYLFSVAANAKKAKTTVADAGCETMDATTHCRLETDGKKTAMGATDAFTWKSKDDAECLALVTANCRCLDGSAGVGDRINASTDFKCKNEWTSCQGATEIALALKHCRKPISGFAYTTAADSTCMALAATEGRCPDFSKKTCTRSTTAGKTEECADLCVAAATTAATAGTTAGGEGEATAAGEGGEGGEGGAAGKDGESKSVIFALFAMILAMF